MKLDSNKKILMLGLILLILAGIIVVTLKGMNVSLMMGQHKSLDLVIGKNFEMSDIKNICNEVFSKKEVALRRIDIFGDSVNVNVVSITDEEKNNLITKINEKYEISLVSDNIEVNSNSNIRIRDIVKPYVAPLAISMVIIFVYIAIRFRKLNIAKVLGKLILILVLTESVIASAIAITRMPVSSEIINLMAVAIIVATIIYINKKEKALESLALENSKNKKK